MHIQSFRLDLISSYKDQNDSDYFSVLSPSLYISHSSTSPSPLVGVRAITQNLLLPWYQEEEEIVQCFYRFLAENERGFAQQLSLKEQGGQQPSSVCFPPGWVQQSVLQLGTEVAHSALIKADGPDCKITPVLNSAKSPRLLLAKKAPQQSSGIKFKFNKSCIFFPKSAWVEELLKAAWG